MFGASFAKRFLIRSLHDAVHLVTKAKFNGLTPDAVNERQAAAQMLAAKAKDFVVPLVKAFLVSFASKNYGDTTRANEEFDRGNYRTCMGILIGTAKGNPDNVPVDVSRKLERLKKVFPDEDNHGIMEDKLLECDGPGVMLLELASKYDVTTLAEETSIFDNGVLHEQIENDLRGSIQLVGNHGTIACGEAKSSFVALAKAKKQLQVRATFMETVVKTMFPGKITSFVLIGHVFIPHEATEGRSQLPPNEVTDQKVSIYIHTV